MSSNHEDIQAFIRKNYAEIAQKGAKGCGCGCNPSERDERPWDLNEISTSIGYSTDDINSVPEDANMGLGCGNPIAAASLRRGETVLDLGSGGGFDCFLARQQVGEDGYVIGVDMTPEMVALARKNAQKSGYENMDFRLGEIEHLPVADNSIDVIISNCVINLSQDKQQVFNEAYRVLKNGGRLCVSDIVATAQLPQSVKDDLSMIAGCLGGAEYVDNLKANLEKAHFTGIKLSPKDNLRQIFDKWVPNSSIEDYVASYIIEASKG